MKLAIAIIVTALIVGGGTYAFVHSQASTDKAALQNTIDQLNANIVAGQVAANLNATVNTNTLANTNTVANTNTTNTNTTNTNSAVATACTSAHLTASLTNGQGTAGTYYYTLGLKNTGTASCTYSGSTKASLLDVSSTALGNATSSTSPAITIGAGKSIYASVGFPDASLYANTNGSTCVSGVTTLAVTPPGQTTTVKVANIGSLYTGWTNYACSGFSVGSFSTTQP